MRKDFKKVLCEEPRRHGHGWSKKALNKTKGSRKKLQKQTKDNYEDWITPQKESMFGRKGRGDKSFGEHLAPLVRYLRSNVGRKWDDIYSEIRQVCPNDNPVNSHIYIHLWSYVSKNIFYVDGKPWSDQGGFSPFGVIDHGRDNTFYVDLDGILRRAPRQLRRFTHKKDKNILKKGKDYYIYKNNVWYKALVKPISEPKIYTKKVEDYRGSYSYSVRMYKYANFYDIYLKVSNFDVGYNGQECVNKCKNAYGKEVYCYKMQQINSREIKKLGLKS